MEKKLAVDAVMRSTACKLSSIYALKVEDDGDHYYVSFYTDYLFYEAYVEKETGIVCGINTELNPVSPFVEWEDPVYRHWERAYRQ